MLIEFSVRNFRSIKEKVTLSMVADEKNCFHKETHLMSSDALKNDKLLRSAVIYGANASGKSNVLKAFSVMRGMVLNSTTSRPESPLNVEPYLFDVGTAEKPSEFEVVFIAEGVRYQYGFIADKNRVFDEWLYSFPKGRARMMLEREYQDDTGKYKISFGKTIKGAKKNWEESTRKEMLLLSVGFQFNGEDFTAPFMWFRKASTIGVNRSYQPYTMRICSENELRRSKVVKALTDSDLGIEDIVIRKEKIQWLADIPEELREKIGDEEFLAFTRHSVKGGGPILMEMDTESDGTQKIFGLIGPWIDILENGRIVFVDELSDKLHPMLLKFLIQKFNNPDVNKHNAQIIFTSHDTALMKPKYLRRDQIWFIEKNKDNFSKLYPLTDFKGDNDDDFEREYLYGQYGALPYLREIDDAMGEDDE